MENIQAKEVFVRDVTAVVLTDSIDTHEEFAQIVKKMPSIFAKGYITRILETFEDNSDNYSETKEELLEVAKCDIWE